MTTKMERDSPTISPLLAGCASAGFTTLLFQVIFCSPLLYVVEMHLNLARFKHSMFFLQPLDLLKTRMQERQGLKMWPEVITFYLFPFVSVLIPFCTKVRAIVGESGVSGLWAGVTPSLWRTVPGVGIYFLIFHKVGGCQVTRTTFSSFLDARRQEASRLQPPRHWWLEG